MKKVTVVHVFMTQRTSNKEEAIRRREDDEGGEDFQESGNAE